MTDTKHTPDRIWAWYFLPKKQNDVMLGGWNDKPDRKDAEYLLATPVREAAPELLEALIEVRADCVERATMSDVVPIGRGAWDQLNAAIAKARGEVA